MPSPRFTAESTSNGMIERDFVVGEVPGVLWSPAPVAGRAPLVLMGHAGGNHKRHPAMIGGARRLVTDAGFHVAVIDAPGHGDRPRTAYDDLEVRTLREARQAGEPEGPIARRYSRHLAELAVPEWRATLDALQDLPEIGADGPVGYCGFSLGTAIGVPLVAAEPRISAAMFGLFWADTLVITAKQITVPIEFAMQWDDEDMTREDSFGLFDAFASKEKTLHANAGRHHEVPRFETDSAVRFFQRHLKTTHPPR
ncbi:alpha/beta hydrolase [Actinoplanes sp. NPDC000266]